VHQRCGTKWGMRRLLCWYEYPGMEQSLLKKVKYKYAWEVVREIGEDWAREVGEEIESLREKMTIVCNVPMFEKKKRERGFDQAEELAKILAEKCRLEYRSVLERVRETKPQYGLGKKKRGENMVGVFRIKAEAREQIRGRGVLLVDDIWTTGSTLCEAAKVVARAGAREVWGLTLAR